MKKFIFALALLGSFYAYAGADSGGGGDVCEDQIKVVRYRIQEWLKASSATGIILPYGTDAADFTKKMLQATSDAKIRCVGEGDPGFPVEYKGTPKVCRFDKTGSESTVTCDFKNILAMKEQELIIQIHHEYAGLAGFELPDGGDSKYDITNQAAIALTDDNTYASVLECDAIGKAQKHISLLGQLSGILSHKPSPAMLVRSDAGSNMGFLGTLSGDVGHLKAGSAFFKSNLITYSWKYQWVETMALKGKSNGKMQIQVEDVSSQDEINSTSTYECTGILTENN
jgi:hypothetical protein